MRLRAALDVARIGTFVGELEERRVQLDDAARQLLGISPHVDPSVDELILRIDPLDRATLMDAVRNMSGPAGESEATIRFWRKSEERRWLRIHAKRQPLEDGASVIVGSLLDVTDQHRRTSDDVGNRAMQYLGLLVDEVARSSGDLLTVTQSYTALMLEDLEANDPMRSFVQEIRQAAERNEDLTRRLTTVARRRTGRTRLLTVRALVEPLRRRLTARLQRNQSLTIDESNGCLVNVDPDLIAMTLELLVDNAAEAAGAGGQIHIALAKSVRVGKHGEPEPTDGDVPSRRVVLRVEDSGPGIPDDIRDRILEPFFTTKADSRHAGLGLSICDVIARMHEGSIRALRSTSGGVVELALPCLGSEHDVADRDEGVRRKHTVLLVEDEFIVRQLGKKILVAAGFEVLEAPSGEVALEIAREHPGAIDLLVTDVVMPRIDGRELANRLKGDFPDIGVLYVSGFSEAALGARRKEGESFDLLPKPFHPNDLVLRVRAAIERSIRLVDRRCSTST